MKQKVVVLAVAMLVLTSVCCCCFGGGDWDDWEEWGMSSLPNLAVKVAAYVCTLPASALAGL